MDTEPIDILLVEDNPGDVFLINRMLEECPLRYILHRVDNGEAATDFLRQTQAYPQAPIPQLILLDLNLPIKNGREVLADIKSDPKLQHIPVIVLSTSNAPEDIAESYQLKADYYVTKPSSFDEFSSKAQDIHDFWLRWQKNNESFPSSFTPT
jgi:CheY-like chemotaxis protein